MTVREQAAMICALAASSGKGHHICVKWLGVTSKNAITLARDLFYEVQWAIRYGNHTWEEVNAEAEAIIRGGDYGF